ncbi:MAG: porin [Rhodobacteraceae bacterium]|nr:porin [Paracoccaceae bacterium]
MKKVLFATTALIATAGVASADITMTGSAAAGFINNGDDNADIQMYNSVSATATMSGATDNGLDFGATLTFRAGDDMDLDVGDLGDNAADGDFTALSATSLGSIYVSGAFGKLTFDEDGIDNLHDDDFSHDVQYDYSAGGLSLSATFDVEDEGDSEEFSVKVGYTTGPLTITAAADDSNESDTTVAYVVNDMLTLSVNYDTNGQGANESETIVKAAYSAGALTGHIAIADDEDDEWEVGLGYTAGALTLGATFAENDGAGDNEYDLSASYNMGGGMTIDAGANEAGAFFLGTSMSF